MARMRYVKPEFWTSNSTTSLSCWARLLFIGMWNFSDDRGVHPACARTLKREVLPDEPFTVAQMEGFVQEMLSQKLIRVFESNGERYWHVVKFLAHQKIDKSKAHYKYPAPPEIPTDGPPRDPQGTPEGPLRDPQGGPDRNGMDGTGEDTDSPNGESCPEAGEPPAVPDTAPPEKPAEELSEWEFPTVGGIASWTLPRSKLDEYREAFPGVDLERELRKARQWCRDKVKHRKTPRGMPAFLNSWLSKAQNESSRNGPQSRPAGYGKPSRGDRELFDPGTVYQGDPEPSASRF